MATDLIDEAIQHHIMGGLRTEPMLDEIAESLNRNELDGAYRKATRVIDAEAAAFSTPAHERFVKAQAYALRAATANRRNDSDACLADYRMSADLGYGAAAHSYASHLSIESGLSEATGPSLPETLEAYFRMAAELGAPDAMDVLAAILERDGRKLEQHYWYLVKRMAAAPEVLVREMEIFHMGLSADDRSYFARAMAEFGVSGGPVTRSMANRGVAGRSPLTAAFVDLFMRRQLSFVWRAFYSDARAADTHQDVLTSYGVFCEILARVPLVDLYLLVGGRTDTRDALIVSVERPALGRLILPGDSVVASADARQHVATVWSVDRERNSVALLDPFPEFWQPSHNSAIEQFAIRPYRYHRSLIELSLSELSGILVALMTIRDPG